MSEKFLSIDLPPGVFRNGTKYQAKGRWYSANLVRWADGALRPVGGWAKSLTDSGGEIQVSGFPRASHTWRKNDSTSWIATGTQSKLYEYTPSVLSDVTPGGLVAGQANGTIITAVGPYGSGAYGAGPYGTVGPAGTITDADTWSLDNFGEILLACLTSDGKIYESTPTAAATQVTNSPTGCRAVCVTPERFVFAIGASSDPRLVKWSSQEARTTWTPAAGNSAGSVTIQTNGRLMRGWRTARETLLWTDADIWSATYIGGPFFYRFDQRSDNCGLLGPNAVTLMAGAAYWMSEGKFFVYDGAVHEIPCAVTDYVFGDLNRTQRAKISAVPVAQFGEVWWFYPSASQSGLENDRYVALNAVNGYWMIGSLARAAGSGSGVFAQPMMWGTDGKLRAHETGQDREGQAAFVESGPLELGNGDRTLRLQTLLPDEIPATGELEASFYSSFHPLDTETVSAAYALAAQTSVRVSGRHHRLRISETVSAISLADGSVVADGSSFAGDVPLGGDWRIGTFRLGTIPEGGR